MPGENFSTVLGILAGIATSVLILLIVLWLIRRSTNPKICKKKVTNILKRFALIRHFSVLSDVNIAFDGKTAHFDNILVGFYGISFIVCISETAAFYGQEDDEKWSRMVKDKKEYFPNPLIEAGKAEGIVRNILSKNQVYNVPIEKLLVFAGAHRKTEVNVKTSVPALKRKELKKQLDKVKYQKDLSVNVGQITDLLNKYTVERK